MHFFIKFIFTVLGGILIGLGLGIMLHKNGVLSAAHFEVATVFALVSGGFLLAMGLPGKKIRQETETVERQSSQPMP